MNTISGCLGAWGLGARLSLGVGLGLGCAFQGQSQTAEAARLPREFNATAIDAFLEAYVKPANVVGLSVAILKDGQVVLARGYGHRALEDELPVEPRTRFAIGSLTKQFACACVLLLAEEGRLSVRDPVARFYPDLTRAQDITLLDLMTHLSGYPDYYPLDFLDRRMQRAISPDDLLRQYAGGRLDFEPGTRWSYSNTGYILLGRIVEQVTGEPFGTFLGRRILEPLNMHDTVCEPDPSDPRGARGHTRFALSEPEPIRCEANGWLGAAGGMYSTPNDLAKWALALMAGRVFRPETLALMTDQRALADGRLTGYGCGLGIRMQEGRQVLSHGGAVSGFSASIAMVPGTRSGVIMMSNLEGGLGDLPGRVLALLLKRPDAVPPIAGPPADEAVRTIFRSLQRGRPDRKRFSAEFNQYLTDAKVRGAARRLKPYGSPREVQVVAARERGGMEVTTTRLTFKAGQLEVLMYRGPDGAVEQFFVSAE